ncbi:MAG: hypothetical protein M0P69_06455 [Bacteroidales bacterium]|nr:hypothetical protein [Bacteroidales bacterium]
MENILIKEKMALAVDEAFFNIKKLVMEAMDESISKDEEFVAFVNEASNVELVMAIKFSLLEMCAVEIYRCVHPTTPYKGELLREFAMEYVYRIYRKLHTA